MPALVDRSRAPRLHPQATPAPVVARLVELRKRFPTWGPKKLRAWLMVREPEQYWPSESTIGALLKREGLVQPRPKRRRTPYATQPLAAATDPNYVWCADFKGAFRVGGKYCHPLTITDACSRYLIRCEAFDGEQYEPTRAVFESAFREYGKPLRIRTDNGSPFASKAPGGLSRLSVWWVKLGILPERIEPGKPQQNGRHERMHRTLKQETARPAHPTKAEQQAAFDSFRVEYNNERPHEALGQQTPASRYEPSQWPLTEPEDPIYPDDFEVRRVHKEGTMRWRYGKLNVSAVLAHEVVGLEPLDNGHWQLWFGPIYLGLLKEGAKSKHQLIKNLPST